MNIPKLVEHGRKYADSWCHQSKRHVSFILRGDEIVSHGANGFEVPSRYAFMGYRSLHSEVHAMIKLRGSRDGLSLINLRYNNRGELKIAKPCKLCMPWCEAVFDNIYYSTDDKSVIKLERIYD
jgi:hypothetical protein